MERSIVIEYPNANGVPLCLRMNTRPGTPKSKNFTISFRNTANRSTWAKISLFLAVLFNIIAVCYLRTSLMAIMLIFIVFSVLVFFWLTHSVQSESLVVIPTVGIQSSVKYVYGKEDNFITWSSIDDVIINEVLKFSRVLYFLTIIVKVKDRSCDGANVKLIPVFNYTKPRLGMLERIHREVQSLLSERIRQSPTMESGDIG